MDKEIEACVLKFRDDWLQQFPLVRQLKVAACLADLRGLECMKKIEWLLRSRSSLRLCVGLQRDPQLMPATFGHDRTNHTVLSLNADLLARLHKVLPQCPFPDGPNLATILEEDPVLRMRVVHMALYAAELDQDYDLGLALRP